MGLSPPTSWLDAQTAECASFLYGCRFFIPVSLRSLGESNSCVFSAANAFPVFFNTDLQC